MSSISHALQGLGLGNDMVHVAACDNNATAKKFWINNYASSQSTFYDDVFGRNYKAIMNKSVKPNIYECGFPCQPFSNAGKQLGKSDKRGQIIDEVYRAIDGMKPDLFVLENVEGLLVHHPKTLATIVKRLRGIGSGHYTVHVQILNSVDHGIPQNRKRLWFVGIAKKCDKGTFTWPSDIGSINIDMFLEPPVKAITKAMPPDSQTFARQSFLKLMKEAVTSGLNPLKETIMMDIESTKPGWMVGVSPCLTRSRAEGHWISTRGRRQTINERLRLMGIDPKTVDKMEMTPNKLGQLIGNAQSANVLERILYSALPSAGIVPVSQLRARWETKAQAAKTVSSFSKP